MFQTTETQRTQSFTEPDCDVNAITGEIIDASIKIHKYLGPGLFERVYEECLCYELQKRDLPCERQSLLNLQYEELSIENAFKIDLLVCGRVIVELKSAEKLLPIHETQILTYMKLTKIPVGLLINFNVPLLKHGLKRFKL